MEATEHTLDGRGVIVLHKVLANAQPGEDTFVVAFKEEASVVRENLGAQELYAVQASLLTSYGLPPVSLMLRWVKSADNVSSSCSLQGRKRKPKRAAKWLLESREFLGRAAAVG